jgi:hypothetical protein
MTKIANRQTTASAPVPPGTLAVLRSGQGPAIRRSYFQART